MEKERYHTPQQTPTVTDRRRRRRESVIPGTSNSPIVINLDICEDELKKEVARLERIVRDQADMISDMKDKMDSKIDESILIDASNKISDQAAKNYEHDFALVHSELSSTRELLRRSKDELASVIAEKRIIEKKNESLQREILDKDEMIKSLEDDKTRLIGQVARWENREAEYLIELDGTKKKSQESVWSIERKLSKTQEELQSERRKSVRLEERIKELSDKILDMEQTNTVALPSTPTSNEITQTVPVVTHPDTPAKSLVRRSSVSIVNIVQHHNNRHLVSVEEAHQKIGALSVQCAYQQRENQQLMISLDQLRKEMDEADQRAEAARTDLAALQLKMVQKDFDVDKAHKYLFEENEKTKQQKAELRGELMKVQREYALVKQRLDRKESESTEEEESLKNEVAILRKEKEREESAARQLAEKVVEAEKKIVELEERISEMDEIKKRLSETIADKQSRENELETANRRNLKMKELLKMLDEDSDKVMKLKNEADEKRKRAEAKLDALSLEVHALRDASASKKSDYDEVVAERDRLKTKVHFLNEELKETHTDYREELTNLARQISEKKKDESRESEVAAQLSNMRSDMSRAESDLRNERRQRDQLKLEVASLEKQMLSLRESEKKLHEENVKLRQGLADTVAKIEQYKSAAESAKEELENVRDQLNRAHEKSDQMEEEIGILEDTIKEKERLAAYLHSQTNAKQMPKVSRKSTLLRQPSMDSFMTGEITIVDSEEIIELENKKKELYRQLEKKKHELSGRKEEVSSSSIPTRTPLHTIPTTSSSSSRPPLSPIVSNGRVATSGGTSSVVSSQVGVMRHDIPHRWKEVRAMGLSQIKCATCFEGISRIGIASRCLDCKVVVHKQCTCRVENTCGMPLQCATYYLDSHRTPSSSMNGWVRIYRNAKNSQENSYEQWRSAWARLDGGELSFFDNDCLAENNGKPFFAINLSDTNFSIRAAAEAPDRQGDNCIHIHMEGIDVYLLAPTAQARGRWAEALQSTRGKRMEAIRRNSTNLAVSSMLFGLDAPANLNINASYCLDDWILIGCQEGLFVTSLTSPRAPFAVSGITAIYALEGAADISMLICVCGPHRTLAILSFSQLRAELAVRQPIARPSILSQFDQIHLIMYTKVGNERFLAACNSTEINILKYNDKRDTFVAHHVIPTSEPAMCLTPWHSGFFFGGDSFYSVNLDGGPIRAKSIANTHHSDYPIAILPISDRELLMCYQNHGRFVNPDGILTRKEKIEWDQTPLEFCFVAPYVYVVSMSSLEILQVIPYSSPSTPAFQADREVVKTYGTGAHIVGKRSNGDVYLSLSSANVTELHSINAAQKRTVMKRKGSASLIDKRSKTTTSLLSNQ